MNHLKVRRDITLQSRKMYQDSKRFGIPPEAVAYLHVKANLPRLTKFVYQHGMMPSDNPALLALQAAVAHEKNIQSEMAKSGLLNYETAEDRLFNNITGPGYETRQGVNFTGEEENVYSDFAPGLFASIFKSAKAGINKINEKRVAKGKKPILQGEGWQNFFRKVTDLVEAQGIGDDLRVTIKGKPQQPGEQSELSAGLYAAHASLVQDKTKDWLRKNWPFLAIGAVLLIVVLRKK